MALLNYGVHYWETSRATAKRGGLLQNVCFGSANWNTISAIAYRAVFGQDVTQEVVDYWISVLRGWLPEDGGWTWTTETVKREDDRPCCLWTLQVPVADHYKTLSYLTLFRYMQEETFPKVVLQLYAERESKPQDPSSIWSRFYQMHIDVGAASGEYKAVGCPLNHHGLVYPTASGSYCTYSAQVVVPLAVYQARLKQGQFTSVFAYTAPETNEERVAAGLEPKAEEAKPAAKAEPAKVPYRWNMPAPKAEAPVAAPVPVKPKVAKPKPAPRKPRAGVLVKDPDNPYQWIDEACVIDRIDAVMLDAIAARPFDIVDAVAMEAACLDPRPALWGDEPNP